MRPRPGIFVAELEPTLAGTPRDSRRKMPVATSVLKWFAAGLMALVAGYIVRGALEDRAIDYPRLRYRPFASDIGPGQASWSADGKLIAYNGAKEGIFLRNLDDPPRRY